jgi:hypothetical protein
MEAAEVLEIATGVVMPSATTGIMVQAITEAATEMTAPMTIRPPPTSALFLLLLLLLLLPLLLPAEELMLERATTELVALQVQVSMEVVVPTQEIREEILEEITAPTQGQTPRLTPTEDQAVLPPFLTQKRAVLLAVRQAKHQTVPPNLRQALQSTLRVSRSRL